MTASIVSRILAARETAPTHLCVWDANIFEQVDGDRCDECLEEADDDRDDPGAF